MEDSICGVRLVAQNLMYFEVKCGASQSGFGESRKLHCHLSRQFNPAFVYNLRNPRHMRSQRAESIGESGEDRH
jgi:hypothetical protein